VGGGRGPVSRCAPSSTSASSIGQWSWTPHRFHTWWGPRPATRQAAQGPHGLPLWRGSQQRNHNMTTTRIFAPQFSVFLAASLDTPAGRAATFSLILGAASGPRTGQRRVHWEWTTRARVCVHGARQAGESLGRAGPLRIRPGPVQRKKRRCRRHQRGTEGAMTYTKHAGEVQRRLHICRPPAHWPS